MGVRRARWFFHVALRSDDAHGASKHASGSDPANLKSVAGQWDNLTDHQALHMPRENNDIDPRSAAIAQELGIHVGTVKSTVSRLRTRYGELVRQEVGHTVSSPAEIPDELRHLLAVIGA
jgi:hypothetical protein